ncbi:MAG: putative polymerase subfamily sigma factor [Ilumatobacteraceae bacterium]|nr:putative polymerase subfamily sigma factor [Ilumatobacteraceae bacterium]
MTVSGPDDHTLLAAARAGDRSSLDQLLRRHYDRIYAVCRRITGNDADAADAAQDAMIAIVRSLAKFDGRSSFSTWAYRIATNASLDELRRRRRRPVPGFDAPGRQRDDAGDAPTVEHADPDAGLRVDAIGDRLLLDEALAALAEDFRVPVVLRDVGDLDYAEIAELLAVPVGTVKSRIARGRAQLAVSLGRLSGNQTDPDERRTTAP